MDKEGGKEACSQEISSPWDLVQIKEGLVAVAAAGTHQVNLKPKIVQTFIGNDDISPSTIGNRRTMYQGYILFILNLSPFPDFHRVYNPENRDVDPD